MTFEEGPDGNNILSNDSNKVSESQVSFYSKLQFKHF